MGLAPQMRTWLDGRRGYGISSHQSNREIRSLPLGTMDLHERPNLSKACLSAPPAIRERAMSWAPKKPARCSAVRPEPVSAAFTSAPAAISALRRRRWLPAPAQERVARRVEPRHRHTRIAAQTGRDLVGVAQDGHVPVGLGHVGRGAALANAQGVLVAGRPQDVAQRHAQDALVAPSHRFCVFLGAARGGHFVYAF